MYGIHTNIKPKSDSNVGKQTMKHAELVISYLF
jgi:hypothetical protein